MYKDKDVEEILISQDDLEKKTKEIAAQISGDFAGEEIVLIGVLRGGFIFIADLSRQIPLRLTVDFIAVSSYGNSTKTSGVVKIIKDIDTDITGKNVIIIEDLIDTGLTLKYLKELLHKRGPKEVKTCAILDKPSRRETDIEADYKGIEIPDKFVVGYGLDYNGMYRNIPYVCTLKPEIYKKI